MPAPPQGFHIFSLPAELINQILHDLDVRSLLVCRQVCRTFNDIITDAAALQYKIELAVAGMDDGPPSGISPAERLEKLQDHRDAWDNLKFTSEKTIPMLRGEVWELYGGVLAQARGRRNLAFRQLPSVIRGVQEEEWTVGELGFTIRDFGMDPSQDLLVVIENRGAENQSFRVHLHNLLTGAPHASAPNPAVLEHTPSGDNYSYAIQISAQYLGVFFISGDEHDNELLIWNWKTGARHLWLYGPESASFTFLSDRHILLGAIDRDDELQERQPEPTLVVMDFLKMPNEKIEVKHAEFLCAFHFPVLSYWATPLAMSIRSDPAPSWHPHSKLKVPFYTAKNNRLFVITFWMADALTVRTYLLFVPSATLMSRLYSMPLGDMNRHFVWEQWGPTGTRMMLAPPGQSSVWVCYVFGMKFVSPTRRTDAVKAIHVYDFNALAVEREDCDAMVVSEETTVQKGRIFQHEVTTSLPYRRWTLNLPAAESEPSFDAVMLSEDTLLTVTSQPTTRTYRILTL